MASVELVQRLATLQAGRNITLRPQAEVPVGGSTDPPSALGDGIDVSDGGGVILAWVLMELRANPSYMTSEVRITSLVSGETYSVTLNYGDDEATFSYLAGGGDAQEDVLQQIADDINAESPQRWNAYVLGTGASASLFIEGVPAYSTLSYLVSAAATGSGSVFLTYEASAVLWRLWGLPRGSTVWVRLPIEGIPNAESDIVQITNNYGERYVISGMSRLYVEVVSTDGTITPTIAPALEE